MTLIVDAAPLVATADLRDPRRQEVQAILLGESLPAVVPAPVTAEVDYLLGRRVGSSARQAFQDDLAAGRFAVGCLSPEEHETLATLNRAYRDLDPGLADLSLVVLARRFRTRRLLTFDERAFRVLRPLQGGTFTLLPADA